MLSTILGTDILPLAFGGSGEEVERGETVKQLITNKPVVLSTTGYIRIGCCNQE